MRQSPTYPVAEILRTRSIPFVFMTGYSREGIDQRFAEVVVLKKPIDGLAVGRAIASLIGQRADTIAPKTAMRAVNA